jgi:hypothetical protein
MGINEGLLEGMGSGTRYKGKEKEWVGEYNRRTLFVHIKRP